jgi:hypothetical protein
MPHHISYPTLIERKSIVKGLFGSNEEEEIAAFDPYFKVYDSLFCSNDLVVQIYPPILKFHDDMRQLNEDTST